MQDASRIRIDHEGSTASECGNYRKKAGSQIEAGSPIQAGGFRSLVSIEAGSLIQAGSAIQAG